MKKKKRRSKSTIGNIFFVQTKQVYNKQATNQPTMTTKTNDYNNDDNNKIITNQLIFVKRFESEYIKGKSPIFHRTILIF